MPPPRIRPWPPTERAADCVPSTPARPAADRPCCAPSPSARSRQQLPLAVAVRNTALRPAPSRATVRTILRHADGTPPVLR
ncbi:hypothetical protein GTY47_34845 [Streptomyces sp. SID5464]|nr:hypothetical protein [Streptomyces sp. SID5464]